MRCVTSRGGMCVCVVGRGGGGKCMMFYDAMMRPPRPMRPRGCCLEGGTRSEARVGSSLACKVVWRLLDELSRAE
jgi:hypothetical protein